MITQLTHSRVFAAAAAAFLFGTLSPTASAGGWIPMRLHGTATVQSIVPIGGDASVVIAEVTATEVGWGNVWGNHTSTWHFVGEFDAVTLFPLRGSGEIVQTNEDGSTLIWQSHFVGDPTNGVVYGVSIITGGTGRFENAVGVAHGETRANEDGTSSYKDRGWITGIEGGRSRGAKRGPWSSR